MWRAMLLMSKLLSDSCGCVRGVQKIQSNEELAAKLQKGEFHLGQKDKR